MPRYHEAHELERDKYLDPSPSSLIPSSLLRAPSSGPGMKVPRKSEWAKMMGTIPLTENRFVEATQSITEAAQNYYWAAVSSHEVGLVVDSVLAANGAARCLFGHHKRGDDNALSLEEVIRTDAPTIVDNEYLLEEFAGRYHELLLPLVISAKEGPIFRRTERLHEIKRIIDRPLDASTRMLGNMADGYLPCAEIDTDY